MLMYLVIGGLAFVLIELVVPGIGIFGLLGALSFLAALYLWLGGGVVAGYAVALVALLGVIVFYWILAKFPQTLLGKVLILPLRSTTEKGYISNEEKSNLLGCIGKAHTVLRPAGVAEIQQQYIDVVTEGSFIDAGTDIVVVVVTGSRVVVRALPAK